MKRLLLITLLANTFLLADAQCTPDITITQSGVYPEQPDTAFADVAYDFNFQILALKDTTVIFAGQTLNATIDSVRVNSVIGLPAGFEYACNPASCVFTWRAVGCVNVKGNPTQAQAGIYDLKIATTAFAQAGILALPVPDTTEGYQLVIKGDGSASIFEVSKTSLNIYPNPSFNRTFMLSFSNKLEVLNIVDLQGKSIDFVEVKKENNTLIDLSSAPKGIYFLQAKVNGKLISKKLVQ